MKKSVRYRFYGLFFMLFWMSSLAQGQISLNTVKYNITYNPTNQVYTAWLIPDYIVPNLNNISSTEFGGTAQFTIVVPKNFVITNITDVRGTWTKTTDSDFRKLGPGQVGQTWVGLNPALNYYLIGKAPSETNYGVFALNVPVALFTFTGNSCFGAVKPLPANDPFIAIADNTYGLNVGNSFYSRSGQPSGGNQKPLEQFVATTGISANCLPLVANPDFVNASAGVSVNINVLANDKNNDSTAVNLTTITAVVISTAPTKGLALVNLNGTISYAPFLGSSGTDTFIYTICDINNITVCDTALVTIAINQKPNAINDIAVVPMDKVVLGNVLTNDFDLDGNKLTVSTTLTTTPTKGVVVLNADGTYTYTPNIGVTGKDTFCYQVCDNGIPSACDTACVFIQIIPPPVLANNKPIANDDNAQTAVSVLVNINVKANDTDPDGFSTLGTPILLTNPLNGVVVQLANGTFNYTPNLNFIGQNSFTYSICDSGTPSKCDTATVRIDILPTIIGNQPPVALDDVVETVSGATATIFVRNNDYDPDGIVLTNPTIISQPASGTVIVNANGSVTYTPNTLTFIGTATFKYAVCDVGIPVKCDTASVSVLVLAPNKVSISPRAYLQGALFGIVLPDTLMRDDLRVKNLIPTTSPYLAGLTVANTTTAGVLAVTGKNAIVDWVFIELRSSTDATLIIDSRSALIQRDGDIVGVDGVSPVSFSIANSGQYYLAVKHRNHLGVMSTLVTLSNISQVIDFTKNSTPTFNLDVLNIINQAQVTVLQGKALWAGNALNDSEIIYQGTGNDVNMIYQEVVNASGNIFLSLSFKLKGYFSSDIDMNGESIFQGTGNDVEFIYQNVIKNHIGNTLGLNFFKIKQQIP